MPETRAPIHTVHTVHTVPTVPTVPIAHTTRVYLALVVAAALAVHARAVGFGFSYLDDDVLIIEQQGQLTGPSSVARAFARPYFPPAGRDHAYYRPLVTASYAIDAAWSGDHPRGYHLTNVLLAALAAGLLFRLLLAGGYGPGLALFGGLLYAVHPALAETTTWIPGRPDGLMVVFALAAWLLLGRALDPTSRVSWASRAGHLLAWLAALLCKEAALVLPVAYAGHLLLVERRPLRTLAAPWLLGGWVLVLSVYLIARARVLPDLLGAAGVSAGSFSSSVALLVGSLGKLALPVDLSVMATPEDTRLWPGIAAAVALAAIAFVPGIRRARLLFAVGCFALFVLPGAPASHMLALESRLALPGVAIVLAAAEIAQCLPWPPRARFAAAAVLVAGLAGVTFSYAGNFRDRLSFAEAAVRGSPHAALAHRNLGVTYHLAGDTARARKEYATALIEDAGEPIAHNNLAVLLMAEGRLAEAEQELRAEIAINPKYAIAHDNLARVLAALGRAREAADEQAIAAGLSRASASARR